MKKIAFVNVSFKFTKAEATTLLRVTESLTRRKRASLSIQTRTLGQRQQYCQQLNKISLLVSSVLPN